MPAAQDAWIANLQQTLGGDAVILDEEQRRLYSTDLYSAGAVCKAVIRPRDSATLGRAVAILTEAGAAVVPRGGGLTYVGGYTPLTENTVVVDVAGMDRIVEINEQDLYVTVEAGVTWKQIYEALAPRGLRLPFFGTFSGARATVGGGLSNGALFLGTARYGSAADILLGLEVVLADGSVLMTGQGSVARSPAPFFRAYGPDLTGLFVHDAGAFGVKTRATLRVIRMPAETDYLCFAFARLEDVVSAISEVGRAEAAEDAYAVDPDSAARGLAARGLGSDIAALSKVVAQEKGLLKGIKAGAALVRHGRDFAPQGSYLLNLVLAGKCRAAVEHDLAACRRIAAERGGVEIPNSIPKAARADLFAPLNSVVDADGRRWAALNAKVAHSQARGLVEAAEAIFDRHRAEMDAAGVRVSLLFTVISNHAFSYECVFRWIDSWSPLHRLVMDPAYARSIGEPASRPQAYALVDAVRTEIVDLFTAHGAASSQIGKTYPYLDHLLPETRRRVTALKAELDPKGLMNPGALGFGLHAGVTA